MNVIYLMQRVNSEIKISGSIEQVWEVISDLKSYCEWNSQLSLIRGEVFAGERLRVAMKPLYYRAVKSTALVKDLKPVTRFGLSGINIIPGLLKMECLFTLSEINENTTNLHLHQRYYGMMAFILNRRSRSIEARKSCFKMNAETKRRVEDLFVPSEELANLSA